MGKMKDKKKVVEKKKVSDAPGISKELSSETKKQVILKPVAKIKKSSPSQSANKASSDANKTTAHMVTTEQRNNDQKNKEKSIVNTKENGNDQKQKLGGLIFMCNARTKPDCFRYMVMGFPENRKELVLSIKPDLKLFLYDYDTKLLYGIYKASSAGGLRLEPAAFNGSYGAQVRFKVDRDCSPLPISIFKNAIKENLEANKNMFRTELTVKQVDKLTELFYRHLGQPNSQTVVQNVAPIQIPVMPLRYILPAAGPSHLHQSIMARVVQPNSESVVQNVAPVQIPVMPVRHILSAEGPSHLHQSIMTQVQHVMNEIPQQTAPCDPLALCEKDYRTYGLLQRRRPPSSAPLPSTNPPAPILHPYQRQDSSHLHPYGVASLDPYTGGRAPHGNPHPYELHGIGGELIYGGRAIDSHRADAAERMSHTQAGSDLADYYRRMQQPNSNTDLSSLPVSSRYSFAGPTLSYR